MIGSQTCDSYSLHKFLLHVAKAWPTVGVGGQTAGSWEVLIDCVWTVHHQTRWLVFDLYFFITRVEVHEYMIKKL